MKIIKQGSVKNKKKFDYRFECSCGCIFHCEADEVMKRQGSHNEILASHHCPTCGETLYGKEYLYR